MKYLVDQITEALKKGEISVPLRGYFFEMLGIEKKEGFEKIFAFPSPYGDIFLKLRRIMKIDQLTLFPSPYGDIFLK